MINSTNLDKTCIRPQAQNVQRPQQHVHPPDCKTSFVKECSSCHDIKISMCTPLTVKQASLESAHLIIMISKSEYKSIIYWGWNSPGISIKDSSLTKLPCWPKFSIELQVFWRQLPASIDWIRAAHVTTYRRTTRQPGNKYTWVALVSLSIKL